ncbi:phosphotransferase family protein [Brevibacterium yomogidense]|uniref:phosphotransferase family protein n=1 Tax=Brevibacterium yomogidense TaxID=946573 RepID=UPI0018DF512F|nr:phosphotransferase family protein [Brevibacterium yomogidense]
MTNIAIPSSATPGLDLERFGRWHADEGFGPLVGELRAELITGGKSNLTYRVYDDFSSWVVRRPPLGHVQETAHDMGREFRVMSSLGASEVPVPGTYALCTDLSVLGANFYVMEYVRGISYRNAEQLRPLGPETTTAVVDSMIDVLAALHSVRPPDVGLSSLGRPEGFLGRQVRRWGRQLEGSRSRDLPDADRLLHKLNERADTHADGETSIVHGDYRLDNLLVRDGAVHAVIDWEMATLGDPLTDLALLFVYHRLNQISNARGVATASMAPGYPGIEHQLLRYQAASGRRVNDMSFHLGLAHFKLAVILEGIHYRHVRGGTVGDGFADVGASVQPLLAAGLRAIRRSTPGE